MAVANQTESADVIASGPAPRWAELVATFFGAGYMRPGPGTWGSAGAVITWAAVAHWLPPGWLTPAAAFYALLATAVGIPAATLVARAMGKKDPSKVVIDEVAGQMVALIGAPLHWGPVFAGFILFRAFDILKPWPIRSLERLPEGVGIVVDDLGAGVYALIVLQLLLHYRIVG
jgi:phosphatidylglycerophosphatase A